MHQDFSTFVGAWALLLSCLALVIEPLAHGSRWFNRTLRLSAGLAGLVTFLTAHTMWTHIGELTQVIPAAVLAEHPDLWESAVFEALTRYFLVVWGVAWVLILPMLAPSSFYWRVTGLLAGLPLIVSFVFCAIWMSVDLQGFQRLPEVVSIAAAAVMVSSGVFFFRWAIQQKIDQLRAQVGPICHDIGQMRMVARLKSTLLREEVLQPPSEASAGLEHSAAAGTGHSHG